MLHEAYLGLGSNLGDRHANIAAGLDYLREFASELDISSFYETSPQGFREQPPFINIACRMWTRLSPLELLSRALEAEARAGRVRTIRDGPRTLDVDILLYGRDVLTVPGLSIPHPRMAERAFVLVPLAEIAAGALHPVLMETVGSLLKRIDAGGVTRLHSEV